MKIEIPKHFKQRQTFYRLVASFLTMLLLPLLLVMVNYLYAHALLREENLNYQNAVLQQVQLTVDERLQGLQLHALDLNNDSMLNQVLEHKINNQEEANLALWQVSGHLANYAASPGPQCDTFIYSSKYDCLINGSYIDYRVSSGMSRFGSQEMNQLMLEKLQNTRVYCQYDLLETAQGESQLVLFHTMPLWSTGQRPYATICLTINPDALFAGITEMEELDTGVICLISPEGRIAARLGDAALLDAVYEAEDSYDSFQSVGGISYTLSQRASKLNGWRFISLQPEHTMVAKLNQARNVSLIMLACVLVVGIFIGYVLAYRNYEPLKRLMAELHRQSVHMKSEAEGPYGEYNLIELSMKEMAHSISALENTLEEEMPRIQESLLMQLFRNAVTDYDRFQNTLQRAGILLPFTHFRVALVKGPQDVELEQQVLVKMIFRERVFQLAPKSLMYVFATVDDESLVLLMNGDSENFDTQTRELLDAIAKDMRESYDQMFWISASEIGIEMESVSKNFYSVVQAQPLAPEGGVRYLTEGNETYAIGKAIDNISAQMQNYIATGNDEGAIEFLHKNLENDIRQKHVPLYEAQAYCISILNVVTSAYRVEDSTVLTVEGQLPLKLLFLQQNTHEMEEILASVIRNVCAYVRENQQSPTTQLTSRILEYIQGQYGNVDLTLTSVADYFDLTSSYFSVFFKNNVGKTFLNYLTHLRMEKAKELMRTTNDSIAEISEKVGYASANTFTRSFKKIEQITPSQYRESCQNDSD